MIIDVLRATSTIATVLYNGAKSIIPVDSVAECIRIGKQIDSITAGERDEKSLKDWNTATRLLNIPVSSSKENPGAHHHQRYQTALWRLECQRYYHRFVPEFIGCLRLPAVQKPECDKGLRRRKNQVKLKTPCLRGGDQPYRKHFSINCDSSQIATALYKDAKSGSVQIHEE